MMTLRILRKKCWLDDLLVSSCIPASWSSLPAPLTVVGALITIFSAGANRFAKSPPPAAAAAVTEDADDWPFLAPEAVRVESREAERMKIE